MDTDTNIVSIKQREVDGTRNPAFGYDWEIPGEAQGWAPTYKEAKALCIAELIRRGHEDTARRLLEADR